jgi:predicted Fe-Mo cluster-binding NifX family protein
MIVAIPMDAMKRVYHYNPCSATMFAIYDIIGDRKDIRYRHIETRLNPWERNEGPMVRDPKMKACECEADFTKDPHHISEHYALLEVVGKCNVLIADQYCLNILYAMKNVGIKIHKIPPFLKTPEEAINHFIIGANLADHLQYINPAS